MDLLNLLSHSAGNINILRRSPIIREWKACLYSLIVMAKGSDNLRSVALVRFGVSLYHLQYDARKSDKFSFEDDGMFVQKGLPR